MRRCCGAILIAVVAVVALFFAGRAIYVNVGGDSSGDTGLSDSSTCTEYLAKDDATRKETMRRLYLEAGKADRAGDAFILPNADYECGQRPERHAGADRRSTTCLVRAATSTGRGAVDGLTDRGPVVRGCRHSARGAIIVTVPVAVATGPGGRLRTHADGGDRPPEATVDTIPLVDLIDGLLQLGAAALSLASAVVAARAGRRSARQRDD